MSRSTVYQDSMWYVKYSVHRCSASNRRTHSAHSPAVWQISFGIRHWPFLVFTVRGPENHGKKRTPNASIGAIGLSLNKNLTKWLHSLKLSKALTVIYQLKMVAVSNSIAVNLNLRQNCQIVSKDPERKKWTGCSMFCRIGQLYKLSDVHTCLLGLLHAVHRAQLLVSTVSVRIKYD